MSGGGVGGECGAMDVDGDGSGGNSSTGNGDPSPRGGGGGGRRPGNVAPRAHGGAAARGAGGGDDGWGTSGGIGPIGGGGDRSLPRGNGRAGADSKSWPTGGDDRPMGGKRNSPTRGYDDLPRPSNITDPTPTNGNVPIGTCRDPPRSTDSDGADDDQRGGNGLQPGQADASNEARSASPRHAGARLADLLGSDFWSDSSGPGSVNHTRPSSRSALPRRDAQDNRNLSTSSQGAQPQCAAPQRHRFNTASPRSDSPSHPPDFGPSQDFNNDPFKTQIFSQNRFRAPKAGSSGHVSPRTAPPTADGHAFETGGYGNNPLEDEYRGGRPGTGHARSAELRPPPSSAGQEAFAGRADARARPRSDPGQCGRPASVSSQRLSSCSVQGSAGLVDPRLRKSFGQGYRTSARKVSAGTEGCVTGGYWPDDVPWSGTH